VDEGKILPPSEMFTFHALVIADREWEEIHEHVRTRPLDILRGARGIFFKAVSQFCKIKFAFYAIVAIKEIVCLQLLV